LFAEDQPVKVQVLVFAENDKLDDVKEAVVASATANKGKALYVHVDETNERVFQYFGISADDFPTFVLVTMDGAMKKYMPADSDFAKLDSHVSDFFAGNLKPTLKSDPIPESQDEAVYVLVGKEFNDVALDDSRDVLVEFCAPWCGHCKSLAPKYDELGEKFAGVDTVVIAKMDATANEVDHPDVNVQGFPTLKFFPANSDGKVIDYDGARETDAMYDFVVANAGAKIVENTDDKDEL
jgi:protein disulfide-isomerase A1